MKRNKVQNRFLALFLISQAIGVFSSLTISLSEFFFDTFPQVIYLGLPAVLLWGPTLFFYSKSIIDQKFFTKKHLLHFLPAIGFIVYLILIFYFEDFATKKELYYKKIILPNELEILLISINQLQIFSYIIASFYSLKKYQKVLKDNYSSNSQISLIWLKSFLYWYLFACIISFSQFPLAIISGSRYADVHLLVMIVFFVFFSLIFYKALFNPQIFIGEIQRPKYKKSALNRPEQEKLKEHLIGYMIANKPYLKSSLKLEDIAADINTPSWKLSQVINQSLGSTYFDFVNRYRIDEAKKILIESDSQQTILEILYQVGFNSKAAFNRAFKKAEGITPTQFRTNNK